MTDRPNLKLVDIYSDHRARIKSRDWGRVHVEGDRREPVTVNFREPRYSGVPGRMERGGRG